MDFKFSKGSDEISDSGEGAPKKNQSALLVLLVILVGGFGYIYFFTGLIKPQEQPPAPAPAPAQQAVKKPLPPRDGDAAAPKKEDAPAEAAKAAAVPPAAVKPVEKTAEKAAPPVPAAAKPAPAAPAAVQKPAAAPAKPVAAAQKPEEKKAAAAPAKPVEQKNAAPVAKADAKKAPVAGAKAGDQKQAEAKPAAKPADKNAAEAKKASGEAKAKPVVAVKPRTDQVPAVKEAGNGKWTVQVGSYVLEDALATDLVRVRKAGLEATVVSGGRKKTAMNRLQAGEFADRDAAQAELSKLKKHTSDAFIVDDGAGSRFTLYAGSYLLDSRAASEKERLAAAGFKLTQKKVEVAVPTKILTAGTFADKSAADEALKKLKNTGLKAVVKQP